MIMLAVFVTFLLVILILVAAWYFDFGIEKTDQTWASKYFFASLPAAITVGGNLLALGAFDFFGCSGGIKHMQHCHLMALDITPLFGFGLFFLPLISIFITGPISAWNLLTVGLRHIRALNDKSRS
jgi:hypothetical protein